MIRLSSKMMITNPITNITMSTEEWCKKLGIGLAGFRKRYFLFYDNNPLKVFKEKRFKTPSKPKSDFVTIELSETDVMFDRFCLRP